MSDEGLPPDFEPRTRPRWKRTASSFAILFVGIMSMKVVASGGGRPESSTEEPEALMVEIATLESGEVQAVVESTGVLTSAETIALMAEVSGRVAWVSKNLRIGGRFSRGEALFRVEDVQYKALLAQQQVRLHQAELELAVETERSRQAKSDWERHGDQSADAELATRRPHLMLAEANLAAAQAGLAQAQQNFDRCTVRAPFDLVVLDEQVDPGQMIAPGAPLGQIAGTQRYRLTAYVPDSQLSAVQLPEGSTPGSEVELLPPGEASGEPVARGRVIGFGGQLDPMTKMASILVELDASSDGAEELLLGKVQQLRILGRTRSEAVKIPRSALSQGNTAWVVDSSEKLEMRRVQIGWDLGAHVEVVEGLAAGDRVVVSPLSLPVIGMPVRPVPSRQAEL